MSINKTQNTIHVSQLTLTEIPVPHLKTDFLKAQTGGSLTPCIVQILFNMSILFTVKSAVIHFGSHPES